MAAMIAECLRRRRPSTEKVETTVCPDSRENESGPQAEPRRLYSPKPKVVLLTASATVLWVLFRDQAKFLKQQGFNVCAVSSPGPELERFALYTGCRVFPLKMQRAIVTRHDLWAVLKLTRVLRKLSPDILHTHTPKAGILGTIAGRLAGCPVRFHTYHGSSSEALTGLKRTFVEAVERWTGGLATHCVAVSSSLKSQLIARKVCAAGKMQVIGKGGCSLIDLENVDPASRCEAASAYRKSLEIAKDAFVVAYMGSIAKEKEVGILAEAWRSLGIRIPCISALRWRSSIGKPGKDQSLATRLGCRGRSLFHVS